jgi:hypothetical protein
MPTDAPARTHCPNCGAKLHRQDLSLCAYCATPLSLGGAVDTAGDETAQRVARLREHPAFASAMAWTPPDPEVTERAHRLRSRAGILLFAAVGIFTASSVGRGGLGFPARIPVVLSALAAAVGVLLLGLAAAMRKRAIALPILRRPSLVVVRRSETAERGGVGATVYFFTLHFDDGSEGEFRRPGQGTMYEPMPNGTTGVAYTRGERLIDFRKL